MMKTFVICVALLCFAVIPAPVYGQKQESDAEKLIRASAVLEKKPFDRDAKNLRSWAITYLSTTDEVAIVICGGDLTRPILDQKSKYGPEIFTQYTIAMAAFKLSAPDRKEDEDAAQLAGFNSALKTYEVLLKQYPKARTAAMDDLIAKREKGLLKDLVVALGCGKK